MVIQRNITILSAQHFAGVVAGVKWYSYRWNGKNVNELKKTESR